MTKTIKKDGYVFIFTPAKTPSTAVAAMSIPIPVNALSLYDIKCGRMPTSASKFDETALALAIYNEVNTRLNMNLAASIKAKVLSLKCGCPSSNEFLISAVCDKAATNVRKCLKEFVKALGANFSGRYKEICKASGIKPSSEGFNHAYGLFAKSLKDLSFAVCGRIKYTDEVMSKLAEGVVSKIPKARDVEKGSERKIEIETTEPYMVSTDIKGFNAVLAKTLFKGKIKEAKFLLIDGKLYISAKHAKAAEALQSKSLKEYEAGQKAKLKDDYLPSLTFIGLKCAFISLSELK
jgi:hypothetical protein